MPAILRPIKRVTKTVAKLRRETHTAYSEAASLRLRAAWLYYNQGLTQKDVAEKLGISRSTVIRLLDEAMKRSEVQIWINEGIEDFVELAGRLEAAYGLDEAVIIPSPAPPPARRMPRARPRPLAWRSGNSFPKRCRTTPPSASAGAAP